MKRLYGQFIKPGDLVFNIGANMGIRTAAFLELGARIVAVEPQKDLFEHLAKTFAHDDVVVVWAAAGPQDGNVEMKLCSDPQLATCAPGWAEAVKDHWPTERWDKTAMVPQITLDSLIENQIR